MNFNKKLIVLSVFAFSLSCLEAKLPAKGGKNSQKEMISVDQLQEMQQMEQILQGITVMMAAKFFVKFPKFRVSIIQAYSKDSTKAEKTMIEQVENDKVFEPVLSEVVTEIEAEKELVAMLSELKPLLKQLLTQELIKWVHIAAAIGIDLQ